MAEKKNHLPRRYYLITLLLIIIASIVLVIFQTTPTPPPAQINPQSENPTFQKVTEWKPNAVWSMPTDSVQNTYLGEVNGKTSTANIRSDQATLSPFEDVAYLNSLGYELNQNLSADGPGSSVWGYKKGIDTDFELIIFSYVTTPTNSNPNQPLEFNCPCEMKVEVFIGSSHSASQSTTLSNPVSE